MFFPRSDFMIRRVVCLFGVIACVCAGTAFGQEMPAKYQAVLSTLGRTGDFRNSVLRINVPRADLRVTVAGVPTPTPFGFGGWLAMTEGQGRMDVVMGDLVLVEAQVNPVMSALLDNGLEVTALHNHFLRDEPRVLYMHVHGHGLASDLARRLKPALDLVGPGAAAPMVAGVAPPTRMPIDTARVAAIVGATGDTTGEVYKITLGRDDLKITEMGAPIGTRMGLNSWAAFVGTETGAAVAGDIAMLASEVTPVLAALRANGLEVVAIHHHMTDTTPAVFFVHYWGTGPADRLAAGFRAAIDKTAARR
jgi:hypothetical protein